MQADHVDGDRLDLVEHDLDSQHAQITVRCVFEPINSRSQVEPVTAIIGRGDGR